MNLTKRVLISVYEKDGVIEFAEEIVKLGYEIICSEGTLKILKDANIPATSISEYTGLPECLGGRLKTLHPKIYAGILYNRSSAEHKNSISELSADPIDIVVVNLYPFKETVIKAATHEEIIEKIDIGGVSLVRASAKNYKDVIVLTDTKDYSNIIQEIKTHGDITLENRINLAKKAFCYTSYYDGTINNYFQKIGSNEIFPEKFTIPIERKQKLRYGENPHQAASFYVRALPPDSHLTNWKQLNGKGISYNNIVDIDSGVELIKEFDEPTAVVIKHNNPCGVASADNLLEAFILAQESDPISIFGGIVVLNDEITESLAKELSKIFLDAVVAKSFKSEALEILKKKPSLTLIELPNIKNTEQWSSVQAKEAFGGILISERDSKIFENLEFVTNKKPTEEELADLKFAFKIVKHVKSNAIVLANNLSVTGIGMGQTSRIFAVENAIKRANKKTNISVMASDAFFPFRDCVDVANEYGIKAIIQPGGSVRDAESIEACNTHGISMVFSNMRHFKH